MAMCNHLVVEKIASFLDFEHLKSCRAVNFLWKDVDTRQLRKRGIATLSLNESSVSSIINSDSDSEEVFLWDSVDLDWGFGHSKAESTHNDFGQFFFKFGYNIKTLRWTGADLSDEDHKLWDKSAKLSMDEMLELMKNSDSNMGKQLGEFLFLLPNLESLTIGKLETSYGPVKVKQCKPVTDTLIQLSKLGVTRLTTLNLSSHAFLNVRDLSLLKDLGLKLKNFTWLGKPIKWQNGLAMGELLNSWRSTLENLHFSYSPEFKLGSMPALKSFRVDILFNLTDPLPFVEQFPKLEEMNWNFDPRFNWDNFLPAQMRPHVHLRNLNLQKSHNNISVSHYVRLLEKCPKLKTLSTSAIDDDVASAIFKNLQDLESLDTNPGCSNETFTGVDDPYNATTSALDVLNPYRLSIRKLTKLREVIIRGESNDICVWFGLSLLDNLERLTLSHGVSDVSLERLAAYAPKLCKLTLTNDAIGDPESYFISQNGLNTLQVARPQMLIKLVEYIPRRP